MKKIIIFSTNYFPYVGGAEVAIKEITDRLPEYDFHMIAPRMSRKNKRRERVGNVEVYRVGLGTVFDKWILPFWGAYKARKLHRAHPYDIAWSMMASQGSIAAALFKKKNPQVPLVLTLQEGDEEEHLKRYVLGSTFLYKIFIKPWHMLVFKRADMATAISNYLVERAIQNGIPRDRTVLIPNGVDVERFEPVGRGHSSRSPEGGKRSVLEERALLRERLNIQEGDRVIITTSRLVKKNAVGDIIGAMKYVPANVKLFIAGVGPEEEALKARAYKYRDRVEFLGLVAQEDIPAILRVADVFVRPSLSEGMGNSFIEAMAAGIPVVATPVGGIPDFLIHDQTGLFCKVKDSKSIADQVMRLLGDQNLREQITTTAKKMVAERYDWDMVAKQMKEKIFDK